MSKQPETLRLAKALEGISDLLKACNKNAAKELRRLHEVNQELIKMLEQLLNDMGEDGLSVSQAVKEQAKAALAKTKGEE